MVTTRKRVGRPATSGAATTNRLRELRELRGLTQARLGQLAGLSQQQIGNLERDDRRMTFDYARRLAPYLDAEPSDLMPNGRLSIPVSLAVALAEAENRPERFDLPMPQPRIQPPRRLIDPQDCFAAELFDDSADLLYPAGSTIIARRLDAIGEPLKLGSKIVVRRYVGTRAQGVTMEVLIGLLDRSVAGDLVLITRSSNARVPPSIPIRRAAASSRGLSDAALAYRVQDERISYEPRSEDPGEILGRVEFAVTPE